MVWLKTFLARVGALFHKRRFDKELEEELGFHLEMEAGQNLRNGMSPTEAQRAARLSLGNPELVKEDCRDARNFAWLAAFLQDLRFATRMLRRNPGFTAVVALTLALGVGSVTTIFSAMNAALLQPLPFKDPDRLVWLRKFKLDQPEQWRHLTMSATLRWTEESQSFEGIAAAVGYSEDATISGEGQAESVALRQVSSGLFSLLGVEPQLGRTFLPEDVRNETGDVTMISHRLWLRRYGGDPEICGKTIRVNRNSQALTIIGVMPPDFWIFPWVDDVDLWFVQRLGSNKSRRFSSLARLKPGVHLSQAQAEAEIFAQQLAQEEGGDGEDWGVEARLLNEVFFSEWRQIFLLAFCAVSFVLLISCVNVASLLLARSRRRRNEIALRISLGAGRLGVIRQLLVENLVLALIGGALGAFAAFFGIKLFRATAGSRFLRIDEATIDPGVLMFVLAISILTGLLFGMAPALEIFRVDLVEHLKEGGRRFGGQSRRGLASWLVICEVALTFVLLIGAGLMVNSFLSLQKMDLGFNPKGVLSMSMALSGRQYWEGLEGGMRRVTPQVDAFSDQLLERIEAVQSVDSVGMRGRRPNMYPFRILGRSIPQPDQKPLAVYTEVSPGYFETLEASLLKGRLLNERDTDGSPWVAVINEAMARSFFPDEEPLGQQLLLSYAAGGSLEVEENRTRQIVGVVKDVRHWGPAADPPPVIYLSQDQHPWQYPGGAFTTHVDKELVIRTRSNPLDLAPTIRKIVSEIDKDQAVFDVQTMDEFLHYRLGALPVFLQLFGVLAGMALVLVIVGIYGVMSCSVSERIHEIGVRMALGAQRRDVLKMVILRGLVLTLVGLAVGIAASLGLIRFFAANVGLTRYMENLVLFGVSPTDPSTFAVVGLVILAVGALASWVPARWATKVDPVTALRYE